MFFIPALLPIKGPHLSTSFPQTQPTLTHLSISSSLVFFITTTHSCFPNSITLSRISLSYSSVSFFIILTPASSREQWLQLVWPVSPQRHRPHVPNPSTHFVPIPGLWLLHYLIDNSLTTTLNSRQVLSHSRMPSASPAIAPCTPPRRCATSTSTRTISCNAWSGKASTELRQKGS